MTRAGIAEMLCRKVYPQAADNGMGQTANGEQMLISYPGSLLAFCISAHERWTQCTFFAQHNVRRERRHANLEHLAGAVISWDI